MPKHLKLDLIYLLLHDFNSEPPSVFEQYHRGRNLGLTEEEAWDIIRQHILEGDLMKDQFQKAVERE